MNGTQKALSLLLCAALCFGLLVFPAAAEDALPESPHPYENNCEQTWEYTYPGDENGFFMTFSEDTSLEPQALIFLDENGETVILSLDEVIDMELLLEEDPESEEAERIAAYLDSLESQGFKVGDRVEIYTEEEFIGFYSGDELSGRTVYVPGRTVTIALYSDDSGTDYGFKVESVSATPPEGVLTVSCYLDGDAPCAVECFREGDETYIPSVRGLIRDDKVCVGWSDVPGGPVAYDEYEFFTVTENLSLYAVETDLLLLPEEVFSFGNYDDPFLVNSVTLTLEGMEMPAIGNYYLRLNERLALLRNFGKTLGITPLGLIAMRNAMLYPATLWIGSDVGMSLAAALQHCGKADLLSVQEGAENVRDLEGTPELISLINYYQAQDTVVADALTGAYLPGSAWYRLQLQKVYETVAGGDIVLFQWSADGLTNHTVLLTAAFDDVQGNHVLLAYDPDSYSYAEGYVYSFFTISPDYSSIASNYSEIRTFAWCGDFSGFEAFRPDGSGSAASWYAGVINRLKAIIEMFRELLSSFSLR